MPANTQTIAGRAEMPTMRVFIGAALPFATLVLYFTCSALASDSTMSLMLKVRSKSKHLRGEAHVEPDLLEIKFRDGQLIRLLNGIPTDLAGTGLNSPEAQYLLKTVLAGANWLRSQDVPEDKIRSIARGSATNLRNGDARFEPVFPASAVRESRSESYCRNAFAIA